MKKNLKRIKKIYIPIIMFIIFLMGLSKKEDIPDENAKEIILKKADFRDGMWHTNKYAYKYRLLMRGRLPKANEDILLEVLSNMEGICFDTVVSSVFNKTLKTDEEDFVLSGIFKV